MTDPERYGTQALRLLPARPSAASTARVLARQGERHPRIAAQIAEHVRACLAAANGANPEFARVMRGR